MLRIQLSTLLTGLVLAGTAAAQVQEVATESFDYTQPGLLSGQTGGTGWSTGWWASGAANDEIVIFDQTVTPPFGMADSLGNYAGQAVEFGTAFRSPDVVPHDDISEGGLLGTDGATIWFSFSTVVYQQAGDHYAGVSLWEAGVGEILFIGSPWMTNSWGIDDSHVGGPGVATIAGSSDLVETRIVTRIDYLSGQERLRMWLNPAVPHPLSGPDLDLMVPDHRWNEIRMSSGGGTSLAYWDNLRIEKGVPGTSIGTPYCSPAPLNTTGASGHIEAAGSLAVADNNVSLVATDLPMNQFGIFLTAMSQGFTPNPGGSQGNLCLAGGIGRYNGPGQVQNSGAGGTFSLAIDLGQTPTPTGPTSILAGQTWYFQAWYRDFTGGMAISNFTDGTCVAFQ